MIVNIELSVWEALPSDKLQFVVVMRQKKSVQGLSTKEVCQAEKSFNGSIEDGIDYIERDHAGADNRAGGYGSPQNIRSGEIPDGQQRGDYRNHDAGARDPKCQFGHDPWVEEASFHNLIKSSSGGGGENYQIGAHGSHVGDGGDAQRQPARIVSNPDSYLQPVWLRFISL